MPAGDVWGNSWLSSWNSHWKQAQTTRGGGWAWPVDEKKRRRRWQEEQEQHEQLKALIARAFEPPSEAALPLTEEVRQEIQRAVSPFLVKKTAQALRPEIRFGALFDVPALVDELLRIQRAVVARERLVREWAAEKDDEDVILLSL